MKKQQLEKQILQKELQIRQLTPSNTEISESLCNTLILEKAILKKELENLSRNYFFEKITRFFSPKEKLICDYWNK